MYSSYLAIILLSYLSFRSRITKLDNYERVELERKKRKRKEKNIYVLGDKKKNGDILNERINRINGNKKEENITVDKYGGSGMLPR